MKYVHLENNKILGYYDKEINSTIPKGCLEITEKQWQEALSINANCYENGGFIVKDFRSNEEIKLANTERIKSELKSAKKLALDNIVVDVDGKTFDGNETARTNMISAILSADLIGKTEETWKLTDNTTVLVTLVELKQALALAIQEVGRIVKCTTIGELQ